ncbi:hypothetical protein HY025_06195 [Candidatus Daviesbacteria bacterium]|nr:hypothetical protein [Candidatus Daviesbacteria bacterium]
MASEKHNFIISAIARKIRQDGFKVIYLDGKYQDINIKKLDIPPKIINHKPDIIGVKESTFFCIGEAKTRSDIFSKRTINQISDFVEIVRLNSENKLFIGIPLDAKDDLERLLSKLGFASDKQIKIIHIPEELLPYEEEI